MTLRTKTLTAALALTISATGFALAQEAATTTVPMQPADSTQDAPAEGTTFVATPAETGTEETAAEEPAAAETNPPNTEAARDDEPFPRGGVSPVAPEASLAGAVGSLKTCARRESVDVLCA